MSEEIPGKEPKHVLVVDDNLELARTYRDVLEVFGYRVSMASDGVAGLKFIRENEVDAVLCDLSMPNMEGDEFYEAAQGARPELSRRFIFMTGHVDHPKYDLLLKSGKVRVLYKPVLVNTLLEVLQMVFAEAAEG